MRRWSEKAKKSTYPYTINGSSKGVLAALSIRYVK
jgi:hypothetical protein